jgi:hypothetical protein
MDGTTAWTDAHIAVSIRSIYAHVNGGDFLSGYGERAQQAAPLRGEQQRQRQKQRREEITGRLGLGFFLRIWRGLRLGRLRRG